MSGAGLLDAVYLGATVFVWTGAAYKARDLGRDPGNQALRALLHVAFFLGLTMLLVTLGPELDDLHGADAMTSTARHVIIIWVAYQFERFLLFTTRGPDQAARSVRLRRNVFLVAGVTIVLAFLTADAETKQQGFRGIDLSVQTLAWQIAFLGMLAWALGDGARICLRYAHHATSPDLRISLRVLAAGTLVGLLYCWCKLYTVFVLILGIGRGVPGGILVMLVAACAILIWSGVLYPGVAARFRAIPRWLRQRRVHHALYPLWNDLRRAPGMHHYVYGDVFANEAGVVARQRHLHWRFYRRVIEISDMLLHLRPWCSEVVAEGARRVGRDAGFEGDELESFVYAAVVDKAIEAKRYGEPGENTAVVLEPTTWDTLDEDAAWKHAIQRHRGSGLCDEVTVQHV